MVKLSLWKSNHGKDFKFFDRQIKELFYASGVDIFVHKYLGPYEASSDNASGDATLPAYTNQSEKNIQDILFLENRDRKYDPDIYAIRGQYNVGNTDFNLTSFGLFLQSDTLFITFHINDMISRFGRKIMSGDVFEMPHLVDYWSLDNSFPIALKKFYVVEEATRASEGFSPTWWPHLWRCKITPMVNSQEFQDIINQQNAQLQTVKGGAGFNINDLLSTINDQLSINDAVVSEAISNVPLSGYDTSLYYVTPETNISAPADFSNPNYYTSPDGNTSVTASSITPSHNIPGYLTGDSNAPNGWPVQALTYWPDTAQVGQYVLRLDYQPNRLFRYNGMRWVKVNDVNRAAFGGSNNQTLYDSFVNNTNQTVASYGLTINEKQPLSTIFSVKKTPTTQTVVNVTTLLASQGTPTTSTLPSNYGSTYSGQVVMIMQEINVTIGGNQTITIPGNYQFYKWSLNGIAQMKAEAVTTGPTLTIMPSDPSDIQPGDYITVEFIPEVGGITLQEITVTNVGNQSINIPMGYVFYNWSLNGISQKSTDTVSIGSTLVITPTNPSDIQPGDYIIVEFIQG